MSALVLNPNEKDPTKQNEAINQLAQGRSNAVGSVTLTANAASTTVTPETCGAGSVVFLSPTTSNAAAEIKNGTIYISAVAAKSFTIAHANNAQTDRIFGYVCLG